MKKLSVYKYGVEDEKKGITFYNIFTGANKDKIRYKLIVYRGLKIYPWFNIFLSERCRIRVQWVKSNPDYLQGIKVSSRNVKLKLVDGSNSEIRFHSTFLYDLWFPEAVALACYPLKLRNRERRKNIENRWFGLHGVWKKKVAAGLRDRQPWNQEPRVGNYGVIIENIASNGYRLYFNCGYNSNAITFNDLIVEVFIDGPYIAGFQCCELNSIEPG